jgi:hypothetical protein
MMGHGCAWRPFLLCFANRGSCIHVNCLSLHDVSLVSISIHVAGGTDQCIVREEGGERDIRERTRGVHLI